MDFIATLFGYLAKLLYDFFGNYGLAIIFLTVIIRGAMIPLNISSQKSMLKMQALSGKQAELQRKYGDDKERYQQELTKLQQENGAMGCSGCILPILQIFLIWPIYRIVSGPLLYLSEVSKDNIESMIELYNSLFADDKTSGLKYNYHIALIEKLNSNSEFLRECIDKGYIKVNQLLDLHFLGMDLTDIPQWNPVKIMAEPKTYVPLLVIPFLVLIINIISMQLTKWLKPDYKEQKEAKERAKNNPARADQAAQDQTEATMRMMNWMMPVIMLVTTFGLPAAMGLYWIVGGLMGILTQFLVFVLFTRPYELKKQEVEAKKVAVFKKTSGNENNSNNGKNNKGKKKSKK